MANVKPEMNIRFPDLINDRKLTLSHIDTGCLVYEISGEIHTIIKDPEERISTVIGSREIGFGFVPVLKSEFPSVHMNIRHGNDREKSRRYEYFFMAESETDVFILHELERLNRMYLHVYNGKEARSFSVEFNQEEKNSIRSAIRDVGHLLTKSTL